MGRAFIGLGANQGEPDATFRAAVGALARIGRVVSTSSLYASAPRDVVNQPDFTNAALELETDLEPADLLLTLKRLELTLGRDPQGVRFGPRVIDLDILALEGRCVDDPELDLVIPHPRLAERRFALEPLAELDPNLHPWEACGDDRSALTVEELLSRVADQEVELIGGPEWIDAPN
jgi:2-amino-4-hydroxy-6-hydroxymethyldihydropteridine diphosphokinase